MKITRSHSIIGIGTLTVSALGLAGISQAAPPIVMGYYPSYRTDPSAGEIRFDRFTHIIQSFITVADDGKALAPPQLTSPLLTTQAHAKGAKVLLAMGGGGGSANFGAMVRSPQKSALFIAGAVQMMMEGNSDGLALDWEQPEPTDRAVTVDFVAALRVAMKAAKPDSLLILVVNSLPGNSHGYDGPKLRDNVDFLHVMSYDFHGPWNHSGHHASLYQSKTDTLDGAGFSFPAALTFWRDVQGFRPEQIIFGIAGYGRGFKVKEWGEKPVGESLYPDITFADARALVGRGWTRQWDAESHAPWLLSEDKTERISYDDEQSVADKALWMKENGLPGFFIWEVGQEYVDGDYLLTAAAQKAWNSNPAKK